MPIRNRQLMLPNGYKYTQPETNFQVDRYSSFDSAVNQVISHRLGNPYLIQKNGWTTDRPTVEMEVDNFNTRFCVAMGGDWLQWVTEGGSLAAVPFQPPPPQPLLSQLAGGAAAVRKLAVGAALLFEWEESGAPPVAPELSAKRAAVCAVCPLNSQKELGDWFTGPVSEGIRKKMGRLHQMALTTPSDGVLGVCSACLCPLKLKCHTPLDLIAKRLKPEARAELHSSCWILAEGA